MNITSQYKGTGLDKGYVYAQFQVKPSTLTPSYFMYCVSDRIRNRALVSHCFHRQHHMNNITLLQYLSWENTYCTVLGWECLAYKGIVSQGSLNITAVASILMSYSNTRKKAYYRCLPYYFLLSPKTFQISCWMNPAYHWFHCWLTSITFFKEMF